MKARKDAIYLQKLVTKEKNNSNLRSYGDKSLTSGAPEGCPYPPAAPVKLKFIWPGHTYDNALSMPINTRCSV